MKKAPRAKDHIPLLTLIEPKSQIPRPSARNYALDNLRSFLTALVIVHHTAIPYGGAGSWKIRSLCFPAESIALIIFNALNQTFFMGLFFFLSGHFTRLQISKRRISVSTLAYSRLWRLLLPAIVFTTLVVPALDVMVRVSEDGFLEGQPTVLLEVYSSSWKHIYGIQGQVWYLALVFIFDLAAVLLPQVFDKSAAQLLISIFQRKRPLASAVWIICILSSFAIRMVYPVGYLWSPLGLQLAFLPQYILAYTGGYLSAISGDYFILLPFQHNVSRPLKRLASSIFSCLAILGVTTALEEKLLGLDSKRVTSLMRGGFNIPAMVYATWNEMGFALVGFALLAVFLRHGNTPWRYGDIYLPRYSYGAFLIHPLISLAFELVFESIMDCQGADRSFHSLWALSGPVVMTLVVGVVNVFTSWIAAWVFITTIPYVGDII